MRTKRTPEPSANYSHLINTRQWRFTWVLATTVGGIAGVLAFQLLTIVSEFSGVVGFVAQIAALFAPGFAIGWMQARTFPHALDMHRQWALATALGTGVAPFLVVLIGGTTQLGSLASLVAASPWTQLLLVGVLVGATVGTSVGACQAYVLRDYARGVRRWVLGSGIAGLLSTITTVWFAAIAPALLLVVPILVLYGSITATVFSTIITRSDT
jgi:hypothetical protein